MFSIFLYGFRLKWFLYKVIHTRLATEDDPGETCNLRIWFSLSPTDFGTAIPILCWKLSQQFPDFFPSFLIKGMIFSLVNSTLQEWFFWFLLGPFFFQVGRLLGGFHQHFSNFLDSKILFGTCTKNRFYILCFCFIIFLKSHFPWLVSGCFEGPWFSKRELLAMILCKFSWLWYVCIMLEGWMLHVSCIYIFISWFRGSVSSLWGLWHNFGGAFPV